MPSLDFCFQNVSLHFFFFRFLDSFDIMASAKPFTLVSPLALSGMCEDICLDAHCLDIKRSEEMTLDEGQKWVYERLSRVNELSAVGGSVKLWIN